MMEDTGLEQKPKRGRKRAANTSTAEADEQQWPDEKTIKDNALETEDEQNSPPKKGRRGRPSKAAGSTTPKEETPVKGRRGRKKAAPPVSEEVEEDEEEEGYSENVEQKQKGGKQARAPRRSQQRFVQRDLTFLVCKRKTISNFWSNISFSNQMAPQSQSY